MWPSEDWASRLYDLANWGLVVGLIIGVVSTVMLVWMGNIKEEYLRRALADTNERAARAEKETAQLEAAVAGRKLTPDQRVGVAAALQHFSGREVFISSYSGDAEAARLGLQIKSALESSGIRVSDHLGRSIASGGGVSFGITVTGPEADTDLVSAISGALRKAQLEVKPNVRDSAGIRMGSALTGIMVALKPLASEQ